MAKILLCTDGSPAAKDATTKAINLAKSLGMELVALRVVDDERYTADWQAIRETINKELEEHALRILREVREAARKEGLEIDPRIRHGDASREIISFIREDPEVNLVVMGASGRRRVSRQLIGSVAERVVRQVGRELPCAVMVTPYNEGGAAENI